MALSTTILNTKLWSTTLALQNEDKFQEERGRFRSVFLNFRESSGYLAAEIRKDLPELTVHDISHLDALWEIASIIVGDGYSINPAEAFVLGGAILLHDLSMSVASIEGGYSSIRNDTRWNDLITFEYQNKYDRLPSEKELINPEIDLQKKSLFNLLRQIHAENAEKLAFMSFSSSDETPVFLIGDVEIRQTFGRIIGLIAHSHWWSITEVEKNFGRVIGAPHWCPPEWTIDPLKLACILRVADACHLDARRAPTFLKAFTNLPIESAKHWIFQEKLNKPYLGDDALVFTSGRSFRLSEASAWWLCLDTLRTADRELRSVDALFAEKAYQRFSAKRIAGVDTPERLASYVHTEGWLPISAMVHVTDLPSIIQSIGGKELYGDKPQVAIRELVQNACDAIRARRSYESRNIDFGKIVVKLSEHKKHEFWLEIIDTGIGMSQRVLTEFLLDFGKSFWGSPQMQEEFPGLLSSGTKPTGKYGIGFFSVFMVAEQVQVATRRSDSAARDTLVLEFSSGLEGRPILRHAEKHEQLIDGGTHIKLKLKNNPYVENGILFSKNEYDEDRETSLKKVAQLICPAIDADLFVIEKGLEEKIVTANDWQSMDGKQFLDRTRIKIRMTESRKRKFDKFKKMASSNLRPLIEKNGEVVGRAFISTGYALITESEDYLSGVVTVGGLEACRLSGICGVLVGKPTQASREDAKPIVSNLTLKSWAEEQADLVPNLWKSAVEQSACAQYIWMCGGNTKRLPICVNQGRWMSAEEISAQENLPATIILIDHFTVDFDFKRLESYELDKNVFVTRISSIPGLLQARNVPWPGNKLTNFYSGGGGMPQALGGSVIQAIARAWNVSLEDITKNKRLNREMDIKVGYANGKDLIANAIKIEKPRALE